MTSSRNIVFPIVVAVIGLLSMTLLAFLLQNDKINAWKISDVKMVNITFTLQLITLFISFLAIGVMWLYDRQRFDQFFRLGSTGREEGANWRLYGPVVAIGFTLGNAALMSMAVSSEGGTMNNRFFSLLPLIVAFAFTNAWSEEIFSRFVIIAGLDGKIKKENICLISAIIFGLPHFLGTPSGVFGVVSSGVLGWLLAKSVIETKGLGWAIFIHFLQDIVIFGSGAMIIAGQR